MPVRSYNLKLVVPRGSADRTLREALWTTHAEVNAATRYYEERLLRLRAEPYEVTERTERRIVGLEEAETAALCMARTAQRVNLDRAGSDTANIPGTEGDVLAAMRNLYHLIAPEKTGEGSAQAANGYLSPLTDPTSQGFATAAGKLELPGRTG